MDTLVETELHRLRETIARNRVAFTDMPNLAHLQAGYDARAPNYTAEIAARPDKKHQIALTNAFFLTALKELVGGREIAYLDAGCADGMRTKYFLDTLNDFCTVNRVEAVDYSHEMKERAREVLGQDTVSWGDITNLPYRGDFDLVACLYTVLGHIAEKQIQITFDNFHKVLRVGGYLCIDVIERDPAFLERYGYEKDRTNSGRYVAYFVRVEGRPLTNGEQEPIVFTQRMFAPAEMRKYARISGFTKVAEREIQALEPGIDEMEYALIAQRTR